MDPCKENFFLPVQGPLPALPEEVSGPPQGSIRKGKLVFPGKIAHLKEESAFKALLRKLYRQEWVVDCKPPFENAEMVMDYLGRYTHRVAISNDRLVKLEEAR